MFRRNSKADIWGTSQVRSTVGGRRAAIRVLMDRLNGMVIVYEQESTSTENAPRVLVFESTSTMTRLDRYPEEWRRLSDEALLALRYPHA